MKLMQWSNTRALLASSLLIAVTNAIALSGVAYNRSGESKATLTLTERELQIANRDWFDNDNSGIDVRLDWRVCATSAPGAARCHVWNRDLEGLGEQQIRELGFDLPTASESSGDRRWDPPARDALLVLEYDGPAYQRVLEHARKELECRTAKSVANPGVEEVQQAVEAARKAFEKEEQFASRLFVIDAGLDADALRARYPDRARYAIVRGRLDARRGEPISPHPVVYVTDLDIETLSVPHAWRSAVEPFVPMEARYSANERAPRFAAIVHYGQRLEPWIVELRAL